MVSGPRKTSAVYGVCPRCNAKAERVATALKKELTPLLGGNLIRSKLQLANTAIKVRDACIQFVNRLKEEGLYMQQELKYGVLTKNGNVEIMPLDKYTEAYFNWIFSKAR